MKTRLTEDGQALAARLHADAVARGKLAPLPAVPNTASAGDQLFLPALLVQHKVLLILLTAQVWP